MKHERRTCYIAGTRMMYKEHLPLFKRLQLVVDFLVICAAFLVARELHLRLWPGATADLALLSWIPPSVALLWLFFLDANGLYYTYRTIRRRDLAIGVLKSIVQGGLVFATVLFLLEVEVSRSLLVVFASLTLLFLFGERLLVRDVLQRIREKGWNYNTLLLVGTGRAGRSLLARVRRNPHWGIRVPGFITTSMEERNSEIDEVPVLGTIDDFESVLARNAIDEVAFALPEMSADRLAALIALCEREGVKARVIADLYRPVSAGVVVEELDGLPTVTFPVGPGVGWQLLCKEAFDRLGALALLALLSPLMALIALAIRLDSPGPVFFVQERVGLRKRLFRLVKFRTMVEDAEEHRHELEPLNEASPPAFKMENDPRVTRVGRVLRRLSLDEIPQLWNVLVGEMSFIGPRPPVPAEVEQYEDWQRRRLAMKPGISGLWQVRGRGRELDFADWVRLDLEYIDNWSLALDFRILVLTVPTVLFGRGAM